MSCNLKCSYCFERSYERKCSPEISYDLDLLGTLFERKLMQSNENECTINFFGGEPLLRFDKIKEIVNYLNSTSMRFNYKITTNGTLINQTVSKFLREHKFETSISVDGDNQCIDKRIYRNDSTSSFDDVKKAISILIEDNNDVLINIVVDSSNFHNINRYLNYWKSCSIKKINIDVEFLDNGWLDVSDEELICFYDSIKIFALENPDITIFPFDKKMFPLSQCTLDKTLAIAPNGDIYYCGYFFTNSKDELKIGNLSQEYDFSENKITKEIFCKNTNCLSKDGNCIIGCYGLNLATTGNLYTPSPILCKHRRCSINCISNYKLQKIRRIKYE